MTGKYGVALPYDTEALSRTNQPWVRCECTTSYTKRDLPTPASPTRAPTWPCPACACARAWCTASSSCCRPTKGVRPRTAAACKRRRCGRADPDQHVAVLIGREPSPLDEFKPEVVERLVIKGALSLEQAVGHTAP